MEYKSETTVYYSPCYDVFCVLAEFLLTEYLHNDLLNHPFREWAYKDTVQNIVLDMSMGRFVPISDRKEIKTYDFEEQVVESCLRYFRNLKELVFLNAWNNAKLAAVANKVIETLREEPFFNLQMKSLRFHYGNTAAILKDGDFAEPGIEVESANASTG